MANFPQRHPLAALLLLLALLPALIGGSLTHTCGCRGLVYVGGKGGSSAVMMGTVMAFSRMCLYVHFPTDVLAGFVIGVMIALLCVKFIKPRIPEKWSLRLHH